MRTNSIYLHQQKTQLNQIRRQLLHYKENDSEINNVPTLDKTHARAEVQTISKHAKCPSASRVEAFLIISPFFLSQYFTICRYLLFKSTCLVKSGRPGLKIVVYEQQENRKTPHESTCRSARL